MGKKDSGWIIMLLSEKCPHRLYENDEEKCNLMFENGFIKYPDDRCTKINCPIRLDFDNVV